MKQTCLFLLFFAGQVSAQTIDCQEFEKFVDSISHKKRAMEMRSTHKSRFGTIEMVMEIDTAKRMRGITKYSGSYPLKQTERITIDGFIYTRKDNEPTWQYSVAPPKKGSPKVNSVSNIKSKNCEKVGSEVLDGVNFDIIEMTIDRVERISKRRYWVNFEQKIIKKMATWTEKDKNNSGTFTQKIAKKIVTKPNSSMLVTEYKEVKAIEKPLNAVLITSATEQNTVSNTSAKKRLTQSRMPVMVIGSILGIFIKKK